MKSLAWILVLSLSTVLVNNCFSQIRGRIQINAEGPVHFLVTDSLGRRQGYDPRTGAAYDEIPNTYYESTGIDSHDPSVPPVKSKEFGFKRSISEPTFADRYILEIIGTGSGTFVVGMGLDRWPGMLGGSFELKGMIDVDESVQYTFNFTMDPTKALTVKKIVVPNTLLQDLNNCFKLGLIKNQGLYTSLKQKANNAIGQHDKGQDRSAVNLLQAFLNEVKAQTGKGVDNDAAAILTEDAQALIQQWSK